MQMSFQRHMLPVSFRGKVTKRPATQDQDCFLLYPSEDLSNLWVNLNNKIVMRRLGFHDTRNSSYPSVVFNCMYDDRSELPHLRKLYSLLTFRNRSTACYPLEYWASCGGHPAARNRSLEIY
ncbi:PREDICTED: uncharacterized protein LOC109582921 [Amphimedon queenslandica]|uniref:Uncharacterized protein n=2 Tax=Amphimedon queenslandica TaxID=400682 RepID=A0AAN0J947_AMPQE|nr:PREDICTED: uncharacterized protein LOC109582921 [Amphimedon queenslandica]|eukprot:XP_019853544.1 PREDICTED: uncharacterized protein LOC109582921 [Amphimedon queenslandica]